MWIVPVLALILSMVLGPVFLADTAFAEKFPEKYVPDRLLIKFKKDVSNSNRNSALQEQDATVISEIKPLDIKIIKVPEHALEKVQAAFAKNGKVEFVEKDYLLEPALLPNDPKISSQWHINAINAPQAWDITQGSNSVKIAILDTGVDPNHPDLQNKLVDGYNFFNGNSDWSDVCGHGTKVAGSAAAITNNDIGVAGVSWHNPIIPIRITDTNCYGYYSSMINGIVYAADHGARVANISFQIFNGAALSNAAQYMNAHGGWVVAAAGNTGSFENYSENPYVISVGATGSNNGITSFSTHGPFVDFAAPGSSIYTTSYGGSYGYASGTSFASPIFAGVVALVIATDPSMDAQQIYDTLKATAVDKGAPGWDEYYGWGLVDAYAAVSQNVSPPPIDNTPPTVSIISPQTESDVGDSFTVIVDATDDVSLVNVVLNIDGTFYSQKSNSPFEFVVDSSAWAEGNYEIQAVATDSSENSNYDTISINVIRESNDVTPPTVSFILPQNGAEVGDSFIASVDAYDAISNVNLALYIDDLFFAQKSSLPFDFQIDTTSWAEGSHELKAIATDSNGNTNSETIIVYIVRPVIDETAPDVLITSPSDGSTISGQTNINVAATDDVKLSKVELYVNNIIHDTKTSAPFNFVINSDNLLDGTHVIKAKAIDSSSNSNEDFITVNVETILIPPSVKISSPTDGSTVNGRVTIVAQPSDFTANPSVKFIVDGSLLYTDSSSPYEYGWHTKGQLYGDHTISVEAINSKGETASDTITVTIPEKSNTKTDPKQEPPGKGKKFQEVDSAEIIQTQLVSQEQVLVTADTPTLVIDTPVPVILTEGESAQVSISASDIDGDGLVFPLAEQSLPDFATFTDNGDDTVTIELNPQAGDAGDYTVTVKVFEDVFPDPLSTETSFMVTVNEPNSAPVLALIVDQFVTEGLPQSIDVTASDSNGDALMYPVDMQDIPTFATLVDNGDGTASLEVNPGFEDSGTYTIVLTIVEDTPEALDDSETFELTVLESTPTSVVMHLQNEKDNLASQEIKNLGEKVSYAANLHKLLDDATKEERDAFKTAFHEYKDEAKLLLGIGQGMEQKNAVQEIQKMSLNLNVKLEAIDDQEESEEKISSAIEFTNQKRDLIQLRNHIATLDSFLSDGEEKDKILGELRNVQAEYYKDYFDLYLQHNELSDDEVKELEEKIVNANSGKSNGNGNGNGDGFDKATGASSDKGNSGKSKSSNSNNSGGKGNSKK